MVWKKVDNLDAGTADKFGGNDLDKLFDSLNGVDVSDPRIFNITHNTLRDNTNTAGDWLRNNGTKFVRVGARETMTNYWEILTRDNIGTSYADLFLVTFGATITTPSIATGITPEQDIDFTGFSQVKIVFHYTRLRGSSGAGTHSLRVVDATNSSNVLIEVASITADGRTVGALTTLPGWATGQSRIKVQAKADDATDDPIVHLMQVFLK